jgi:hypothetical protein
VPGGRIRTDAEIERPMKKEAGEEREPAVTFFARARRGMDPVAALDRRIVSLGGRVIAVEQPRPAEERRLLEVIPNSRRGMPMTAVRVTLPATALGPFVRYMEEEAPVTVQGREETSFRDRGQVGVRILVLGLAP